MRPLVMAQSRKHVAIFPLGIVVGVLLLSPVGGFQGTSPQIYISDVFGLKNELVIRPTMGLGYQPGQVTYVDSLGNLESVVGPLGNCVTVGGQSFPCGTGSSSGSSIIFVDGEAPSGAIDGSNTNFTLGHVPNPVGGLHLFRNGVRLNMPGDYTVTGSTNLIVLTIPPGATDILAADYRY
jgi:hypothetical protein